MSAASCHAHPTVPATTSCRSCFRPICDICTIPDLRRLPRCPECSERRSGRASRALVAVVVVAAAAAAVHFVRGREGSPAAASGPDAGAPYDYGESAGEVRRLEGLLDKEPCDRRKIIQLAEAMLRAGDGRGTLHRADAFFQRCGDHPRLRWLTYEAHKQLSEWTEAAAEATRLIDADPYDADFRGWRGLAYEEKGDLDRAAEDYRQALVLKPRLSDLPLNLAGIYERQGKPCDAILPLSQAVFHHPEAANVMALKGRIEDLGARPECAWTIGEGRAQIRRRPGEGLLLAKVRINDREGGTFIVDTGATLVALSRALADKLGIDTRDAPRLLAQTANGPSTALAVTLDKIELQGVKAARVPAAIVDGLGRVEGLLGMSFLSRFDLKQQDGQLEITARPTRGTPPPPRPR
jgi:aspartyl protease family protein